MRFVHISTNPVATNALEFTQQISVIGWRHNTTASIGYDKAEFDVIGTYNEIKRFFDSAIGADIRRYSTDGSALIWEGQIIEMVLAQPGSQMRISLSEMYNKIAVRYTLLDTSVNPPIETPGTTTAYANDMTSQARYGTKELVYSTYIKKMTSDMAGYLRDSLLATYKNPLRSSGFSNRNNELRLHISCEGYMHTLKWRIFNNTTGGTEPISSFLTMVFLPAVGDYFDRTIVDTNIMRVNEYINDDRLAYDVLQLWAGVGDVVGNRWLAYVLDDRTFYYSQASTTIKYFRRISDSAQKIYGLDGRTIPYWDVRPNCWMSTSDVDAFGGNFDNAVDDSRVMFIENIEWDEDSNSLTIAGSVLDKSQILIARLSEQGSRLL